MASWHENRYQNSMNNVNLNELQEIPLDGCQDQSERTKFYCSNHHLYQHQQAQNGFANNGCTYILPVPAMPTRQMPAGVGPCNLPIERTTFYTEADVEQSRAREDREETMNRKQNRSIKNRESAARSRARKLAYKHELENKVVRLEEELKSLKQEMEQEEAAPIRKQDSNGVPIRRVNSGPY